MPIGRRAEIFTTRSSTREHWRLTTFLNMVQTHFLVMAEHMNKHGQIGLATGVITVGIDHGDLFTMTMVTNGYTTRGPIETPGAIVSPSCPGNGFLMDFIHYVGNTFQFCADGFFQSGVCNSVMTMTLNVRIDGLRGLSTTSNLSLTVAPNQSPIGRNPGSASAGAPGTLPGPPPNPPSPGGGSLTMNTEDATMDNESESSSPSRGPHGPALIPQTENNEIQFLPVPPGVNYFDQFKISRRSWNGYCHDELELA